MEKVISKIRFCCWCVVLWQICLGCASQSDTPRESQVPESGQLPAIEPVPEGMNPRWHPGLGILHQTVEGSGL